MFGSGGWLRPHALRGVSGLATVAPRARNAYTVAGPAELRMKERVLAGVNTLFGHDDGKWENDLKGWLNQEKNRDAAGWISAFRAQEVAAPKGPSSGN